MSEQLNLNVFGLSTQSLLMALIIVLLFQCFGVLKCQEGLKPWDTFDARFQQERDGPIGATPAGDSEREKVLRAQQMEGLTGGYETVDFTPTGYEMPPKQESDSDRAENSLEHSLHGN